MKNLLWKPIYGDGGSAGIRPERGDGGSVLIGRPIDSTSFF